MMADDRPAGRVETKSRLKRRPTRRGFLAVTSATMAVAAGCADGGPGEDGDANVAEPERQDVDDENESSPEIDLSETDGEGDPTNTSAEDNETGDDQDDDTADLDSSDEDDDDDAASNTGDEADDDGGAEGDDTDDGEADGDDEADGASEGTDESDESDDGVEDDSSGSDDEDSAADDGEEGDDIGDGDDENADDEDGNDESDSEDDDSESEDEDADESDSEDDDDEDEDPSTLEHPSATNMAHSPVLGPDPHEAEATIIMFDDPSCPACAYFEAEIFPDLESHIDAGELSVVWRGIPVIEDWSEAALEAMWATYEQDVDAFWELRDHLFENKGSIDSGEEAIETAVAYLEDRTYLDADGIRSDAESGRFADRLARDEDAAARAGLDATPYFYLFRNGEFRTEIRGAQDARVFTSALEL